jgi:hypothetical protein
MSCKRKRSADDSPLSVSSFGAVSTPGTQSPIPFPQSFHGCMQMDVDPSARQNGWDFASASRVKSGDWGNRTRKRFRDNRADERAIHGMSLGFLGAAEQRANCMQRTHCRNSSPRSATTQTHRPCHQTPHPPNNLLWPSRSHKSPHCTRSGSNCLHRPFNNPSSRTKHSSSKSTHSYNIATTATPRCRV